MYTCILFVLKFLQYVVPENFIIVVSLYLSEERKKYIEETLGGKLQSELVFRLSTYVRFRF